MFTFPVPTNKNMPPVKKCIFCIENLLIAKELLVSLV